MRTRFLRQHQRRTAARPAGERTGQLIERYLLRPAPDTLAELLRGLDRRRVAHWAEHARRLATRLGRQHRGERARILRARDRLLVQLYAARAPRHWAVGWFDASVIPDAPAPRAGAGGFLLAPETRRLVSHFATPLAAADAFSAEVAALTLLLRLAVGQGMPRLWAFSDCPALVALWRRDPHDPRLATALALADRLDRFRLWHLPGAHNPVAHRLAQRAAQRDGAAGPPPLDLPTLPLEIAREPKFCRCRLCHAHFHGDTVAAARAACAEHARAEHPDWGETACFCPD